VSILGTCTIYIEIKILKQVTKHHFLCFFIFLFSG